MDGTRFDALARALATRLSRRGAVRGAAGVTVGLFGLNGVRSATAATNPEFKRYTGVRQYTSSATTSEIKNALSDLLPELEQITGFIDYSVINGAGDQYLTIAVFVDKTGLDAAATLEADWIASNAKALLPASPTKEAGPVMLHTESGVGCPCTTDTDNACDSESLVCCSDSDVLGGPGICIDVKIGCSPVDHKCAEDGALCPEGCLAGQVCDTCCSGNCQDDLTCVGSVCGQLGTPCTAPDDCCNFLTCFEAVCDNPKGCFDPYGPCTTDADCCEGSCSPAGICYCSDPNRPDVGCACFMDDPNGCFGHPELCCPDAPGAGATGTCSASVASCEFEGCRPDGYSCLYVCVLDSGCEICCSEFCGADGICGTGTTCKSPGDPCEMIPEHGCCEGYTCFEGMCDNPKGCFEPGGPCTVDGDCCQGNCSPDGHCYCTDPDRPDIGCSCEESDIGACGGRQDLCCAGTCISPMANC